MSGDTPATAPAVPASGILGAWSAALDVQIEGGGKAARLHELESRGYAVPPWLCVPAAELDQFRALCHTNDTTFNDVSSNSGSRLADAAAANRLYPYVIALPTANSRSIARAKGSYQEREECPQRQTRGGFAGRIGSLLRVFRHFSGAGEDVIHAFLGLGLR